MIPYLGIFLASAGTACLTLYSGFGLGTILLPVFALFFPLQAAIAATAVVHGANNLIKVVLVGGHADRAIVLRFGIPAVLAAFAGAWAMANIALIASSVQYSLGPVNGEITPLKMLIALMMFVFALFDLIPSWSKIQVSRRYLSIGGLVSGFFGGFSGHQGALRSIFLNKLGLDSETFVGTNAVIGFMVDAARIATYAAAFFYMSPGDYFTGEQWLYIAVGIAGASSGLELGRRFLKKVTMKTIRIVTGCMLIGIAILMGAGVI